MVVEIVVREIPGAVAHFLLLSCPVSCEQGLGQQWSSSKPSEYNLFKSVTNQTKLAPQIWLKISGTQLREKLRNQILLQHSQVHWFIQDNWDSGDPQWNHNPNIPSNNTRSTSDVSELPKKLVLCSKFHDYTQYNPSRVACQLDSIIAVLSLVHKRPDKITRIEQLHQMISPSLQSPPTYSRQPQRENPGSVYQCAFKSSLNDLMC